jgi:hypothetical protein
MMFGFSLILKPGSRHLPNRVDGGEIFSSFSFDLSRLPGKPPYSQLEQVRLVVGR